MSGELCLRVGPSANQRRFRRICGTGLHPYPRLGAADDRLPGAGQRAVQVAAPVPVQPGQGKSRDGRVELSARVHTTLLEYGYGNTVDVSEVIPAELAKIGINAQIKVEPIDAYEAAETGPASKHLPTFQTGGCLGPDVSGYDFFLGSANLAPGQFNTADYAPPAVDKLLAAGIATSNPAARFAIYSQLEERLQSDVPYIALYQQDLCIALSKGFMVPHFDEPGFMFDDYALQVKRAG